ncbi:MAG: hypothetical protein Q9210_005842 [Variospora velana]
MGPNTDKEKVFTRSERMMFENADKVDPMEVIPKLAIRTIRPVFPQSKEVIDSIAEAIRHPEDNKSGASAYPALNERDTFYKRRFGFYADLSPEETSKVDARQKTMDTIDMIASNFGELRTASKAYIFGPMHAPNQVYMKPALEEQWQRLAQKCSPYQSKDHIEIAYWRTLVGNKRTLLAGNVDKPPEFWQNAYNVWHEVLWQKEGMVPRFLRVRGLRRKEGFSATNKKDRAFPEDLRSYFSGLDAEQQKIGLDKQLRASGMRAVLSTAIEISQDPEFAPDTVVHSVLGVPQGISPFKATIAVDERVTRHKIHVYHESKLVVTRHDKPEGFKPLPAETIDEVAGWVRRYPNIQPEEKDRLMEYFPHWRTTTHRKKHQLRDSE